MELLPLDYVLIGVVILITGIGLFRGLSGELGSIAGFAAASAAGYLLLDVARTCVAAFCSGTVAAPAAYVLDFVFALVAFGIVRFLVAKFVSVLVPQPTNAFLGMLGGLFKSVVVVGLLTGVGLLDPGEYSGGFFATHSTIVGHVAGWADSYLAEAPEAPEAPDK